MEAASQVLNLLRLAKTSDPSGTTVPNTDFGIRRMTKPEQRTLARPRWLLVLEGELGIDLPYGDFRILKKGDSVTVADITVTLTPLAPTVVLESDAEAPS
ncbi:MAG: hypothetical protein U5L04_10330 [Trueperaceae bacterium]|nr:hypothetical protein [Trueperaceae bacterium]